MIHIELIFVYGKKWGFSSSMCDSLPFIKDFSFFNVCPVKERSVYKDMFLTLGALSVLLVYLMCTYTMLPGELSLYSIF